MHRDSVESSNVQAVGYDPIRSILEVEFHNGGIYQYEGVTPEIYDQLMSASSKGQFLHRVIRGFPFKRV